jgi:hypothetical protein
MNDHDFFLLKIFVLLLPLLVALTGLAAVWIGGWIDRHEQRHHAAE